MSNFLAKLVGFAPPAAMQPASAQPERMLSPSELLGAPPKPSDQDQVTSWLAEKAKHYPEGTAPDQAAAWQDFDRKKYQDILAQRAAAEQQIKVEQEARQRVIDGFLAGLMPQR